MQQEEDLRRELLRIDGRGYKAYKDIRGSYRFPDFLLLIDHVQGDPFAEPSRMRVQVPAAVAGFPQWSRTNRIRTVALADFLCRTFHRAIGDVGVRRRGSGKSGLMTIAAPVQEVLERSAVVITPGDVEARFRVGLPAQGRRVLGRQAVELLLEDVPDIVRAALRFDALDPSALRRHVESVEDQQALRDALADRRLIAFVADGSVLPRRSGIDPRPLTGRVVAFESPDSLRVEIPVPNRKPVRGLGVPEGVTLIVGGGYHGKSTLLAALELGIYDHVPGDGRELVVARPDAVKIRAEDGRRVEQVDISPFINNLPFQTDTTAFSTDNASGSTSQAANIIEALELGARLLLMDEDTSATNFMIRDHRMQELVAKDKEPITPFIDKVRQLHRERRVSSVIVVGGVGDYFDVADTVIMMDEYRPREVTDAARRVAERYRKLRRHEGGAAFGTVRERVPVADSLDARRGRRDVKIDVKELRMIVFGNWRIDLSAVEQLVDVAQTRTIAKALLFLKRAFDGQITLAQGVDGLEAAWREHGPDLLAGGLDGGLAVVRRFEIGAALNRLRSLQVTQGDAR